MTALAIPPPDLGDVVATPPRLSGPNGPLSLVSADLMPEEIRAKRRVAYLKRRMVFGLIALLLLIGLGDALARQQTAAASADLAAARAQVSVLNRQAARFGRVVGVQSETRQITTLLAQAMAGEVPWAVLTAKLQRVAPRGLTVTGVDGKIGAADDASPATATAGAAAIASLSLTGTAVGYRAVADYVSALSGVPGLTGVTPATAATGGAADSVGLNFTITAVLTTAAQGGRYGTSAAAGAKASSTGNPSPPAASTPVTAAGNTPAATHPSAAGSADAQVGN